MSQDLYQLRDRLRSFAEARNWRKSHTPRNLLLALAAEVGELSAELQWIGDAAIPQHLVDPAARARLGDEIADVLIYLVQLADACGIDPLDEAYAKIRRNEARHPVPIPARLGT